jgi:predicted short-subunit dehydrogenase-like oxidoreductase (DUF2520 family)
LGNGIQALADLAFRALGEANINLPELRIGLVNLTFLALLAGAVGTPKDALTGPVIRGDFATLDAHWRKLTSPADRDLYRALVAAQFDLAISKLSASQKTPLPEWTPPTP